MSASAAADLALIMEAAREAGALALTMRARGLTTTFKADKTPVSDADLAVDALLIDRLRTARPDYGWLSEETVDDPSRLGRKRVFVVDPIDGTRAFVKDRPWWAVCIAVVEAGRPLAAAVFAPDRDELFEALAGGGARRNGEAIRGADRGQIEGCAMLADPALFKHPSWPEPWPAMRIERRNSIAYRLCSVACGEFDASFALSPKSEWDLVAGDLIAREAGCVVTNHRGEPLAYNRSVPLARSFVCAGPTLHELILARVGAIGLPD